MGKRSIGVIGVKRHTGTSHIAQILARSVANAGYPTALLVSRHEDFTNIKDFIKYESVSPEGAVRVGGIDVYEGTSITQTNELQTFSVFDFQVAISGKPLPLRKQNEQYKQVLDLQRKWKDCDCKVLVASTSPQNIKYLEMMVSETDPAELNKWNILLDLTSDRMRDFIRSSILIKAPEANVISVHEFNDPLANPEIPEFAQQIFEKSFGSRFENKVKAKNDQKEASANGFGTDVVKESKAFFGRLFK